MSLSKEEYENILESAEAEFDERFEANACPKADMSQFRSCRTIGGTVYTRKFVAQHVSTKEKFVIRKIDKKFIRMRTSKDDILREKKIQFALESPFVDKLRYAFQNNTSIFFVTEYPLYGTLERIFDVFETVPADFARLIAGQILLGLEYFNACRVVYRNLKPANVLVFRDGYVKLTDFKKATKLVGWVPSAVGTISYMAPEQFATDSIENNVDMWSFGVLLYELLLGEHPFAPERGMQDRDFIEKIKSAELNISEAQKEIIGPDAEDLLRNLLHKYVEKRLGALKDGPGAVKNHAWFEDLDFLSLYEKKIPIMCRWKPETYDVHVSADNSFRSCAASATEDYIEGF